MSTKYKINNPEGIYFITFAVVEWIDVFTRPLYKNLFLDSLIFCQEKKGLIIYAWCLMSNHLHLIVATKDQNLSGIIRDLKMYSSKRILKEIQNNPVESRKKWMLKVFSEHGKKNSNNTNYQFWRQDNQPKELLSYPGSFMMQKLNYIHNNPVVAGIVDNSEDYIYSSARDYAGIKGLINVEFLT
jgi:REP element-mobilizing transposase RayT